MSELMFLVGLFIVVAFLLRNVARKSAQARRDSREAIVHVPRRGADSARVQDRRDEGGSQSRLSDHAARLEVQLYDTGRELLGELQSKMGSLEHLIRDADRAANRLEAALQSLERLGKAMPKASDETVPESQQPTQEIAGAVEALKSLERSLQEITPPSSAPSSDTSSAEPSSGFTPSSFETWNATIDESISSPTSDEPETPAPDDNGLERRYEEVYTLSDYGFEPLEIASRLGMKAGEVELILGLRSKR